MNDATAKTLSEAKAFANNVQPEGCKCENNGDYCEWCSAYSDYLENDEEWRRDALSNL